MSEVAREMQFVMRIFYQQFVLLWTDTQSHRRNFGGGWGGELIPCDGIHSDIGKEMAFEVCG